MSWHLARWMAVVQLPALVCAALSVPMAALLIAATCEVFATGGRWREALAAGLRSAWPGLLPLALLPLVSWAPAHLQTAASAVLFVSSALILTAILCGRSAPAARAGLLLARGDDRRVGVWQLALLCVALVTTVLYLVIAARVTDISDNDGAYYYGVAQHMARTGRFEEPIVWHFLTRPEQIVHAPFDYWGGLTALLLLPGLVLFGASPQSAFLTMSVISAASVIAFWYLVCIAPLLRYRVAQLVALVVFAFSPGTVCFRFQPESTAVAHLFILLALVAFHRRHFAIAVVAGFCILLARGDGLILFVLIVLASILLDGAKVYDFACAAATQPLRRDVAPLDDVVAGQPIASNVPWFMIAYTSSPAVSIPYNGEPAIAQVLERYQPRWLVLVGDPPLWVEGASRGVLRDVLAGKKANLGRFHLERVDTPSPAAVYRIDSEPSR